MIFGKKTNENKKYLMITVGLLTLMVGIVYFDFLVGRHLFFVNAVDVTTNILPNIINLHNVIYSGEFPMWSMAKGLGANITVGNPTYLGDISALVIALLPHEIIPYAIGWSFAIKLVLAGGLFYVYLCEFEKITPRQRILGAILYAFNGHMLCRGAWFHYATEVVVVAFWLVGMEQWYNSRKNTVIIAFALLLVSRSASYVYLYSVLTFGYVIVRHLFDKAFLFKELCIVICNFIPIYILSLGVSCVFLLPGVINILSSGRVGQSIFSLKTIFDGLKFESIDKIIAAYLKVFTPNATGIFKTVTGNILEESCFYGGIISVIFIGTIWGNEKIEKRKRHIIYIVLCLILMYACVIWPKRFLNAFMMSSIKTSSFWVNILLILIGLYAFMHYDFRFKQTITKSILLLLGFIGGFLWYKDRLNNLLYIYFITIIIWIAYICVIKYGKTNKARLENGVLLVCCVEILFFAKISVCFASDLPIYTMQDFNKYYKKYEELENIERGEFYRIGRDTNEYYLFNLSMLYNYFGLTEYDSLLLTDISEMKSFFELNNINSNILCGIEERPGLSNVLSTKYVVSDQKNLDMRFDSYEYAKTLNSGKRVFVNKNFYPFGFIYNFKISKEQIQNFPAEIKDEILMKAAIVDNENFGKINLPLSEANYIDYNITKDNIQSCSGIKMENNSNVLAYKCLTQDPQIIFNIPTIDADEVVIEMKINGGGSTAGKIYYSSENEKEFSELQTIDAIIDTTSDMCRVILKTNEPISSLRFDFGQVDDIVQMDNISIKGIKYPKDSRIQDEYLRLTEFKNNRIVGHIFNESNGLMFLSIPYDKGWQVKVNGKSKELIPVNIAFMGINLEAGENLIELKYVTPGLKLGAVISIISIVLFIFWRRYKSWDIEQRSNMNYE